MSKKNYTEDDVRSLMEAKPFLKKTEAEKYTIYKSTDPFPWIGEALLNSADLLKYLLTVGIIDPFKANNLKGVTYQCTFSGEAHRFDPEAGEMKETRLNDNEELVLERNSITYLKIEEKFHVPDYMVLRFNLSVSNAYKGLLLGTGPIIDPGFDGNLFIPLHNLTGNEYVIKKGASLIRVEFTKLSRHPVWNRKKAGVFPVIEPITKETSPYTSFSKSIEEALLDPDKKQFYTKGGVISVRSSIPDAIKTSAEKADEAQKSANTAANEAKKSADAIATMSTEVDKKVRTWSIIGLISVAIGLFTILLTSFSLIHDANVRYDGMVQDLETCKQQICALTKQLESTREQLEQYETAQPIDTEQAITSEVTGETDSIPLLPSDEADRDDGS